MVRTVQGADGGSSGGDAIEKVVRVARVGISAGGAKGIDPGWRMEVWPPVGTDPDSPALMVDNPVVIAAK